MTLSCGSLYFHSLAGGGAIRMHPFGHCGACFVCGTCCRHIDHLHLNHWPEVATVQALLGPLHLAAEGKKAVWKKQPVCRCIYRHDCWNEVACLHAFTAAVRTGVAVCIAGAAFCAVPKYQHVVAMGRIWTVGSVLLHATNQLCIAASIQTCVSGAASWTSRCEK